MYEYIEKTQKSKSRAVANSVVQKKDNEKQAFRFVNNRSQAVAQRKLQAMANTDFQIRNMAQAATFTAYKNVFAKDEKDRTQQPLDFKSEGSIQQNSIANNSASSLVTHSSFRQSLASKTPKPTIQLKADTKNLSNGFNVIGEEHNQSNRTRDIEKNYLLRFGGKYYNEGGLKVTLPNGNIDTADPGVERLYRLCKDLPGKIRNCATKTANDDKNGKGVHYAELKKGMESFELHSEIVKNNGLGVSSLLTQIDEIRALIDTFKTIESSKWHEDISTYALPYRMAVKISEIQAPGVVGNTKYKLDKTRSEQMLKRANSLANQGFIGQWKIGDAHVKDMIGMKENDPKWNLVKMKHFNAELGNFLFNEMITKNQVSFYNDMVKRFAGNESQENILGFPNPQLMLLDAVKKNLQALIFAMGLVSKLGNDEFKQKLQSANENSPMNIL